MFVVGANKQHRTVPDSATVVPRRHRRTLNHCIRRPFAACIFVKEIRTGQQKECYDPPHTVHPWSSSFRKYVFKQLGFLDCNPQVVHYWIHVFVPLAPLRDYWLKSCGGLSWVWLVIDYGEFMSVVQSHSPTSNSNNSVLVFSVQITVVA
jgi:hypothetical protein